MEDTGIIDTHAHLYLSQFKDDIAEVIERAKEQGVERVFLPNIDSCTVTDLHELCEAYPDFCYPMMGLHPTSVKENYKKQLDVVEKLLGERKYIAVGEIGIDLYWDKTYFPEQQEAFRQQIRWAKDGGLPIVIHARESFREIYEILDVEADDSLKGVFHSFTGNEEDVKKILEYDFYLGINGIVTFKNSKLADTVAKIPAEKLLLETDSPYLAPAPYRGKRNETAYVTNTAEKVAGLYGYSEEKIAAITTANALRLFNKVHSG